MLFATLDLHGSQTEDQPRNLETPPLFVEARQRTERDREQGSGDRSERTGGLFGARVTSDGQRTTFPQRRNGVPFARVKAWKQPTLFDYQPAVSEPEPPAPEETSPTAVPVTPATAEALNPPDVVASSVEHSPLSPITIASGEKAKARDILAAIRTLKTVEQEQRLATAEEKQTLARFAGFGPVALSIFPDPVTGRYKDAGWQALGEELKTCSRRRNTTAPSAPPSTPSTPRRPSSLPCTRRSAAWACPTTPRSWSRAAAPAIS